MNKFSECPNCAKDGVTIPIHKSENGLECALCGSSY